MTPAPASDSRPVALVTGAARRLGRAIALDLAAHGHDVAVHFRRSRDEAEDTVARARALGVRAAAFEADLTDEAACRALAPRVVAQFGRLDAVVHSAALFRHDDAATFTHAAMEAHWRANTAPAVLLAQALHDHLAQVDGVAAVAVPAVAPTTSTDADTAAADTDTDANAAVASPAGDGAPATLASAARRGCVVTLLDQKLWNPNPDHLSYTLSKAALRTATVLLAQALAPRVRVCGVAPGLTLGSDAIDDARLPRLQAAASPLGHGPTAADIAAAVRFMIEAPAVTGTVLLVDAGQHLRPAPRDFPFLE